MKVLNWICVFAVALMATTLTEARVARGADGDAKQATPAGEHPLLPAIRWARDIEKHIDKDIQDYTCTMVKRERIDGKLSEPEYISAKIRHKPFSVYMCFLKPENKKGQEAIYVEGENDGNLLGHGVGLKALIGTVHIKPTSPMAMMDNRYPITEAGFKNLVKRLIEVGENDAKFGECEVKYFKNAKINGSVATCIQVEHPVPRRDFLFNIARIFIDDELNVPIRYEAYTWPAQKGDKPELLEEYTYLNIKLNVGLTNADFDPKNPSYQFK
ncbi:MAG TPA: DUF1571 domain-containing protein [Pirellulales bacterium]|jgi:hypothetical protein|nr:DUF1571 domain-containing protein [Pirellulales bacterium]